MAFKQKFSLQKICHLILDASRANIPHLILKHFKLNAFIYICVVLKGIFHL